MTGAHQSKWRRPTSPPPSGCRRTLLAVVSQSERLARSATRIQGETADLLWLPNPDDELDPAVIHSAHTEIVAAIEAEDDELASQLAPRACPGHVR